MVSVGAKWYDPAVSLGGEGEQDMRKSVLLAGVALCAALGVFTSGIAASVPAGTPVMSGLDNPRHLAFGPGHALYVAEAGRGGAGPCSFIRGETQCAGNTGAISRLRRGVQQRIVTGLPSYAPAGGNGATGPHGVAPHGNGGFATIGLGGNTSRRTTMGSGFGRTIRYHSNGSWTFQDDLLAYEEAHNPDGSVPTDSNPYAIIQSGGDRIATDAGGNDLLRIRPNGAISTLAVFPSRPQGRGTDAVPTSVAVGPRGRYFVGELTGAPFAVGDANVYRVVGGQAQVYCDGFTAIIDIAWGPDDHLYVLQFATGPGLSGPGILYRIDSGCTKTPVVTDLFTPGGIAFGEDDLTAFISQGSILAGGGTVWRFDLPQDDEDGEH